MWHQEAFQLEWRENKRREVCSCQVCGRDIIPEVPRAALTHLGQKHLGLEACQQWGSSNLHKNGACRSSSLSGQVSVFPGHLIGALEIWTAWAKRKCLALGPWFATFPPNVPKIPHKEYCPDWLPTCSDIFYSLHLTLFSVAETFRASRLVWVDFKKKEKRRGKWISQSLTVAFQENVMSLQAWKFSLDTESFLNRVILGHPVHDIELYSSHHCIIKISYGKFIQHLVDDLGKYVTIATGQDSWELGYIITTCQKPYQRATFSMAKPILEIFFSSQFPVPNLSSSLPLIETNLF